MTQISVDYIDHMGTDLSVVNAARVSFDKVSQYDNVYPCGKEQCPDIMNCCVHASLSKRDSNLISYLAKHNHKSPFNHCFASFRVKAPIFVARQLVKHEYMPWNEVSRRYVDSEPEFYVPEIVRARSEDKKQGSENYPAQISSYTALLLHDYTAEAKRLYKRLIVEGCCPEQARMVLPNSTMTEWIWSGSLFAIAKMCKLRLDPHTQYETRLVAQPIADKMAELYPVSWKALMDVN